MGRNKQNKKLASKVEKRVVPSQPNNLEVEVVREQDVIDDDVTAYLASFLKDFASLGPLENISLLSPEEAQQALVTLSRAQERIEQQLKTAQALKRMLSARR